MFQRFVYWTGLTDVFIGLATWAGAINMVLTAPVPGVFSALVALGTSLCMFAALLMWASRDIHARAPIIAWQALVRLSASASVLYALPHGLASSKYELALVFWDGPIAIVYLAGVMRVTGRSLGELLLCRSDGALGRAA